MESNFGKSRYGILIRALSVDFLKATNFVMSSLVAPFKPVILEKRVSRTRQAIKKAIASLFNQKESIS